MNSFKAKRENRVRRHRRVRKKVFGTAERPRLAVFKSNSHVYCQVIDDEAGRTLAAASSQSKGFDRIDGGNAKGAAKVGALIAQKCQEIGVTQVRFDRGCFKYHGRVKALAESARQGGLKF